MLVTSPRGATRSRKAEFFADRLAEHGMAVEALVVNRVHPRYGARRLAEPRRGQRAAALRRRRRPAPTAAQRLAARYANLADLEEVAERERRELAGLEERLGNAAVAHVPELDHDVLDFTALRGRALVTTVPPIHCRAFAGRTCPHSDRSPPSAPGPRLA